MSRFIQMYKKIKEYYDKGEFDKAAEIGELTARTIRIPNEQKFLFHEAMAMSLLRGGHGHEAWQHIYRAMACDDLPEYRHAKQRLYSNCLVYLHIIPELSDDELFRMHAGYGELFNHIQPYEHDWQRHAAHKKIKIGYISPDFYEHIVTNFAIQLYSAYDRSRFEVYLYHTGYNHNNVTDWLKNLADGWYELKGKAPAEAARQIFDDGIDILMDLSGHTKGGYTLQVMSYKPAPIQISGIGYFNTTGLPAVDYYLSDKYCDPPGNEALFTEKLLRLSHSHFCYTPPETVLECKRKWQRHNPVVFGSFSNFLKLNDRTLSTWKRIMDSVPGSRLLLKNVRKGQRELNDLAQRMSTLGFAMERVELREGSLYYLDQYADMDIALDPFPYPGGGTTCEAIYMGVPVITLYGRRHGSRFGYSLLSNIGLEELTARTEAEYIEKAVGLALAPELLTDLHANLRELMRASPVMDVKNYMAEVQAVYKEIYRSWLNTGVYC